jgi:cellulose synthase/poly-beta-1,6-N-acetylglucosamine synthase-like glycosyltransferase
VPRFNKFAIVIPAHDEELVIGQLLDSAKMLRYPTNLIDVIVIADNCTDQTERIAREKGAICFVRNDPDNKGKPHALNWIFQQLDINKYEAFVIIDADTVIEKEFLNIMNVELNNGHHIIQGYFGILNPEETWLTRLMVIPGVLKYKYRYRGKKLLGFSCPLMGNAMCFSKEVIDRYGWDAFSLTENWEYYLKMLIRGYIATYEEAFIYSQTASTMKQGRIQRERWFKGKMLCAKRYLPELIYTGIKKMDLRILDGVIELIMPSISMMGNFLFLILGSSILCMLVWGKFMTLVVWSIGIIVIYFGYFLTGIIANRSGTETWIALIKAPLFLIWKLMVTLHAIVRIREQKWIKTERK